MILLTKLDRSKVLVNLANVKYAEATPDTVLFFLNGDSLIVTEPLAEMERLAVAWQARILAAANAPQPA